MLFDEAFLESLDENPIGAVVEACDRTLTALDHVGREWDERELAALMETAALVNEVIEDHHLASENVLPEIGGIFEANCDGLSQYLTNVRAEFQGQAYELQFSSIRDKYKTAIKAKFAYEFSQGDLDRVQTLINELREQLSSVAILDERHKQRLLARLERLQSELHKRVSDLDRFWGMVGDAGVVLGKLGNDAKPIVDRIREITNIVWRTQARAEELPSGTRAPLVQQHDEHEG